MEFQTTKFQQFCQLNPNKTPSSIRSTSIICTIGKSPDVDRLIRFIESGMNIARLNFSHGSHEEFKATIEKIRTAVERVGAKRSSKVQFPVAIALDTKGPEIRTGINLNNEEFELEKGQRLVITVDEHFRDRGTKQKIYVDYRELPIALKEKDEIFIDDGLICLSVEKIQENEVDCVVECGGRLSSRKGVNLPNIKINIPAVTAKDKEDIRFGMNENVDMIFASFIRNAKAVQEIKSILLDSRRKIMIISKIENKEGVDNIDEIISESDGIMIARGDLGVEIPPEKVPIVQKMIISKCNEAGKPCICATQMLESMTYKPMATRAEISDVANAVFDNSDCTMLSGETAKGEFPLEAIKVMGKTILEAEASFDHKRWFDHLISENPEPTDRIERIAVDVVKLVMKENARSIILLDNEETLVRFISKYRPDCPIFAVTSHSTFARQMNLYRSVLPLFIDNGEIIRNLFQLAVPICQKIVKLYNYKMQFQFISRKAFKSGHKSCNTISHRFCQISKKWVRQAHYSSGPKNSNCKCSE